MTSGGHSPVVELEILPPRTIAVGRGNAFVIGGYCYHPEFPTRGLSVRVGGTRQHVEHARLPRDDVYARVNPDDPVAAIAYRSGFVALVDLAPVEQPERLEIELILTLEDGDEVIAPAGWTDVEPELAAPSDHSPPPSPGHAGPLVSICMATYEPPDDLLRIQLESIREQTHENWVCVISDDHSSDGAGRSAAGADAAATPASSSRGVRSASASTGTSSGRSGDGAGGSRVRDPLRPGRPLASRQARAADRRHRGRAARLQRRPDRQPRRRASFGPRTGPSGATTTRTSARCCSRTP